MPLPRRAPCGTVGRRGSRGQSVVEFALVLPVILLMLLGTIDLGRLFMSWITLNNVVRIAANYAASDPTAFAGGAIPATYTSLVANESSGLNCPLKAVNGKNPPGPTFPSGTDLGSSSSVSMTCKFTLFTPLMTSLLGGPLDITAAAKFPIRTGAIQNVTGSTTLPPPGAAQAAFTFVNVAGGTVDAQGNVTGVDGLTVNVLDGSTNAQTYRWDWGDGSPVVQGTSAPGAHTYTATTPTTYTVTLTVTNPTPSTSTATRTVTVNPQSVTPVADFCGTPTATYAAGGCASGTSIQGTLPLSVAFTNTSTGGSARSWVFGDGSPANTTFEPTHVYSTLGEFNVTLTITSPTGGAPKPRTAYVVTGCSVPSFVNTSTATAGSYWTGAGFTGTLTYYEAGSPGKSGTSTSPPSPARNITTQDVTGGTFYPAAQNKKGVWVCAEDVTVTYGP